MDLFSGMIKKIIYIHRHSRKWHVLMKRSRLNYLMIRGMRNYFSGEGVINQKEKKRENDKMCKMRFDTAS